MTASLLYEGTRCWLGPGAGAKFPAACVEPLSSREREVLTFIAKGASNQEIAEALIIAPNTVKRHIGHILAKLSVSNRTQALVQARKIGLI